MIAEFVLMDLDDLLAIITQDWQRHHVLLAAEFTPNQHDGGFAELTFYDGIAGAIKVYPVVLYNAAEIEQLRRWVGKLQRTLHVLGNGFIEFAACRTNSVRIDAPYVRKRLP